MVEETKEKMRRERDRFKAMMIAAHPDKAKMIEAAFSDKDPDGELSAEETEYFQEPDDETQRVLEDLKNLGFSLSED